VNIRKLVVRKIREECIFKESSPSKTFLKESSFRSSSEARSSYKYYYKVRSYLRENVARLCKNTSRVMMFNEVTVFYSGKQRKLIKISGQNSQFLKVKVAHTG
jgi:hypothetical protein